MKFSTSRSAPAPAYFEPHELPEDVSRAVGYYAKAKTLLAEATAAEAKGAATKRGREDLATNAMMAQREADESFGYLARVAKDNGGRACLCGRVERVERVESAKGGDRPATSKARALPVETVANLARLALDIFDKEQISSTALDRAVSLLVRITNGADGADLTEARRFVSQYRRTYPNTTSNALVASLKHKRAD